MPNSCDRSFLLPFPVIETQSRPTHLCLAQVAASSAEPNIQTSKPLQTGHGWDISFPSTAVLTMLGRIPISLPPTGLQKELSTYSFTAPWEKPSQKVLFKTRLLMIILSHPVATFLFHYSPLEISWVCFYTDDNKTLHLCYQQTRHHPFGRLWGRAQS